MPEWLLTSEQYEPVKDKDTFINKSILSMIGLIARIKAQDSRGRDLFGVNPVVAVFMTFLLVVLVSLVRYFSFVLIVITFLMLVLCLMPAGDIIKVLRVSFVVTVFTFIILLPAAFFGNHLSLTLIPAKVFASVTAVNILAHVYRWNRLIAALRVFRVPNLLIFVLDITLKYIIMLGEFSLEMLYALKLRSVGKNTEKYASLSGIAGTMFLKSRVMAEELHESMVCRGFTGTYKTAAAWRFSFADAVYILMNAGILAVYIYISRG
ncbi:energy-coupling factor transporter transmembrane component T [Oscillospiraceae bacterium WX1]